MVLIPWRLRCSCFVLDRRNDALMTVANKTKVKERMIVIIVKNVPVVVVLRGSLVTRCVFCVLGIQTFVLQAMVVRSGCSFLLLFMLLVAFISLWCLLCLVFCVCSKTRVENSSGSFSNDWCSYRRREDEGCARCEHKMAGKLRIKNVIILRIERHNNNRFRASEISTSALSLTFKRY